MKRLSPDSHTEVETRKGSHLTARAPHARIAVFAFLMLCMSFIALVNVVPVPAQQHGRAYTECMARAKRNYQAAARPAHQKFIDAKNEAEKAYHKAIRADKSRAARQAAENAKRAAIRQAGIEYQQALRPLEQAFEQAQQACRRPSQPAEQTNNNSNNNTPKKPAESSARGCGGNNSTEGTLGHAPRPRNPSVRMDLRVVDEAGRPVQGVKTKLWSERQSNGFSCETVHTTDPCGGVLMDPIHITKTLQLKLEARGFEPQTIQVDPSQLDKPYRAVMQAKKTLQGAANSARQATQTPN